MREEGQPGVLTANPNYVRRVGVNLEVAIRLHGGIKAVAERGGWRRVRSKLRRTGGGSGE